MALWLKKKSEGGRGEVIFGLGGGYGAGVVGTWWWWKNDLVYFLSMTEGIYRDT